MTKIFTIILFLVITSCMVGPGEGLSVSVENNTNSKLTNVKFYTSEKIALLIINDIPSKKESNTFYLMKEHKTDGNFILEFKRADGSLEIIPAGYYSNGIANDKWVEFDVQKDTVLIRFSSGQN